MIQSAESNTKNILTSLKQNYYRWIALKFLSKSTLSSSGPRLVDRDFWLHDRADECGLYNIYGDTSTLRRLPLPFLQNVEIHFILRSRFQTQWSSWPRCETRSFAERSLAENMIGSNVDSWNTFDCFDVTNAAANVYAISRPWDSPLSCFHCYWPSFQIAPPYRGRLRVHRVCRRAK